jgi:two-component system, NarL family, nitrate/nitrite response regulator NarL
MDRRQLLAGMAAIGVVGPLNLSKFLLAQSSEPQTSDPQQVRLVIVDDHPMFRDGLRRLLETEPYLKVVGEASDTAEAMKLVRQFKPDILLTDLCRPKDSGFDTLRELNTPSSSSSIQLNIVQRVFSLVKQLAGNNATPVRVIVLTAHEEKSLIVRALQLGARGFVFKGSATGELLLKGIQTVMMGGYWVGEESVSNPEQYLRTLIQSSHQEARQKKFGLTPRQLDIVSGVVAGYSNKEIAEYFGINDAAVRRHLSNVFNKLGVPTRLELALFAVNHSLPLKSIA